MTDDFFGLSGGRGRRRVEFSASCISPFRRRCLGCCFGLPVRRLRVLGGLSRLVLGIWLWSSELPTDLLKFGTNAANDLYTERCIEAGDKIHPARFPAALPEFFIKLLTEEGDILLDPFAGSNTTGSVAEKLQRRWIAVELVEEYVRASKFRFG